MTLELVGRGKPVADAEITVILPGRETAESEDRSGRPYSVPHPDRPLRGVGPLLGDRCSPLSRLWSSDAPNALPHATSSFGAVATRMGGCSVYGGHVAPTHNYYKEAVSAALTACVSMEIRCGRPFQAARQVQGMNLTVPCRKIYRIGGIVYACTHKGGAGR
jgi:hypothetical protein